ncbi:MAG: hypothetical protein NVSMB43_02150 [Pseudarthrobacter sp.]
MTCVTPSIKHLVPRVFLQARRNADAVDVGGNHVLEQKDRGKTWSWFFESALQEAGGLAVAPSEEAPD